MNLSIRIYGGDTVAGFTAAPLVSVGQAPDGFQPVPPTIVNEPRSYLIVHAKKYTYYAMHMKDRLSTAAGLPGQLLLCLFMPAREKLKDASPLSLLSSLADTFTALATKPAADGSSLLPEQALDSTPFVNVLNRYTTEERGRQLPEMKGQEAAAFQVNDQSQLEAIMRFSLYSELSKVGRLEIGYHCKSTVNLPIGGNKPAPNPEPVVTPPVQQPPVSEPKNDNSGHVTPAPKHDNGLPVDDGKRRVDKKKHDSRPGVDLGGDEPPIRPDSPLKSLMKKIKKLVLILLAIFVAIIILLMLIGRCGDRHNASGDQPATLPPDTIVTEDTMIVVEQPPVNNGGKTDTDDKPDKDDKAKDDKAKDGGKMDSDTDTKPVPVNPEPIKPDPAKELRKQQRAEMLRHINQMDWAWVRQNEEECRKYMSQNERDAVEALYLYNPATGLPYNQTQKDFIRTKIMSHQFSSIEQIVQFKSVLMLELSKM
ncbi:MAG: hypothetical protein K5928_06235 [Prevotella sp.]|nr:hypothetical protein [Prevotella sp.]